MTFNLLLHIFIIFKEKRASQKGAKAQLQDSEWNTLLLLNTDAPVMAIF